MKPIDFVCVGPGRSGTTWLYRLLNQHPEILLPNIKEPEFFNNNFAKGFEWYDSLFGERDAYEARGELSNMYFADISALNRIKNYSPGVKIIFMARRPSELFDSVVKFGLRRGLAINPMSEVLGSQPLGLIMGSGYKSRLENLALTESDIMPIIESVDVVKHLQQVKAIFGVESVYVLEYRRIKSDPEQVVRELCSFMGLNFTDESYDYREVVNAGGAPRMRLLGSFASKLAFVLRQRGYHRLLTRLHNSRWVHALILKKGAAVSSRLQFSDAIRARLEWLDSEFDREFNINHNDD